MSVRLYVGNLPKEPIERQNLQAVFAEDGDSNSITTKVIKDRKTGKCRGFAFITVPSDEIADQFIEKYNGQSFMDNALKIEKAMPRTKGKEKEESAESPATPAKSQGRRDKKRRSSRSQNASKTQQAEAIQPDPRWAAELAKLKEMLTAQTTS